MASYLFSNWPEKNTLILTIDYLCIFSNATIAIDVKVIFEALSVKDVNFELPLDEPEKKCKKREWLFVLINTY